MVKRTMDSTFEVRPSIMRIVLSTIAAVAIGWLIGWILLGVERLNSGFLIGVALGLSLGMPLRLKSAKVEIGPYEITGPPRFGFGRRRIPRAALAETKVWRDWLGGVHIRGQSHIYLRTSQFSSEARGQVLDLLRMSLNTPLQPTTRSTRGA